MNFLLRVINRFFVFLGVIFFIVIGILVYLFIADPFELKPIFKMINIPVINEKKTDDKMQSTPIGDKNPLLSLEQEKVLESFGVDPAALPTEITPEMEKCFREKLGDERVNEIIKIGSPDMADFFKARSCL